MTEITAIEARRIFDSRGQPTVEVEMTTYDGRVTASVPAGTSTGEREAKSVDAKHAVKNINEVIAQKIVGMDSSAQREIDTKLCELDGTHDKGRLGANALLGVSVAAVKANAMRMRQDVYEYIFEMVKNDKKRLPLPYILMAEAGKHSSSNIAIQEFMLIPKLNNFSKSFNVSLKIYHELGKIMEKRNMNINVGY
ncbi:phosphopyruvate hydratase, partial [archaeon]|nr:phosphopyruvate hydratase [archaeon]